MQHLLHAQMIRMEQLTRDKEPSFTEPIALKKKLTWCIHWGGNKGVETHILRYSTSAHFEHIMHRVSHFVDIHIIALDYTVLQESVSMFVSPISLWAP